MPTLNPEYLITPTIFTLCDIPSPCIRCFGSLLKPSITPVAGGALLQRAPDSFERGHVVRRREARGGQTAPVTGGAGGPTHTRGGSAPPALGKPLSKHSRRPGAGEGGGEGRWGTPPERSEAGRPVGEGGVPGARLSRPPHRRSGHRAAPAEP